MKATLTTWSWISRENHEMHVIPRNKEGASTRPYSFLCTRLQSRMKGTNNSRKTRLWLYEEEEEFRFKKWRRTQRHGHGMVANRSRLGYGWKGRSDIWRWWNSDEWDSWTQVVNGWARFVLLCEIRGPPDGPVHNRRLRGRKKGKPMTIFFSFLSFFPLSLPFSLSLDHLSSRAAALKQLHVRSGTVRDAPSFHLLTLHER